MQKQWAVGETINLRVLRLDRSVEEVEIKRTTSKYISDDIIAYGSDAKKKDPSICAVKIAGESGYVWCGHIPLDSPHSKLISENPEW